MTFQGDPQMFLLQCPLTLDSVYDWFLIPILMRKQNVLDSQKRQRGRERNGHYLHLERVKMLTSNC